MMRKVILSSQCRYSCAGVRNLLSTCGLDCRFLHLAGKPAAAADTAGAQAAADLKWREFFSDQKLQSVIELALANNRDLRVAALNIEKAQALYRIQRAEQYPTVGASAGGDAYRVPGLCRAPQITKRWRNSPWIGMASWELDLFGRIRSLKSRHSSCIWRPSRPVQPRRFRWYPRSPTPIWHWRDHEDLRLAR